MEMWRKEFRDYILPVFNNQELEAMLSGLITNDLSLLQGQTINLRNNEILGGCLISYAGWKTQCYNAKSLLKYWYAKCGEIIDCGGDECGEIWCFMNFFDCSPREIVFKELVYEINRELALRVEDDHVNSVVDSVTDCAEPVAV